MDKTLPRRTFLRMLAGAVAVGFTGASMSATKALLSQKAGVRLDGPLSYNLFSSLVGQNFTLVVRDKKSNYRVRLQLLEVNSVFLSPDNDQFYLVFKVFDTKSRPGGVYHVQHATAGSTRLFLQPMDHLKLGRCCRADFNLLV